MSVWMWSRVIVPPQPLWLHSSKCAAAQKPKLLSIFFSFPKMARPEKLLKLKGAGACQVTSSVFAEKTKHEASKRPGLGVWDPPVPRMQPSTAPSQGSHPPVRLCLSSPSPCVVKVQVEVQSLCWICICTLGFFACLGFSFTVAADIQETELTVDTVGRNLQPVMIKGIFLGKTCATQRPA